MNSGFTITKKVPDGVKIYTLLKTGVVTDSFSQKFREHLSSAGEKYSQEAMAFFLYKIFMRREEFLYRTYKRVRYLCVTESRLWHHLTHRISKPKQYVYSLLLLLTYASACYFLTSHVNYR